MSQSTSVAAGNSHEALFAADAHMYVTMRVDRQLFGINVKHVRDVLRQQHITPIPLAPKEVSGSLNLRGRIVTVIDVRSRLGLSAREDEKSMFVVVEQKGELFSLRVDSVGEVLTVSDHAIEKPPAHMDSNWQEVATGIHKLSGELLVIVNIQNILDI
ncbi:MAG: chemotaxis protein CheW [Alphaproteobacteria bacterium]|nr:chemotaxis protein CheW [Alphaproteobacteria bacterium]